MLKIEVDINGNISVRGGELPEPSVITKKVGILSYQMEDGCTVRVPGQPDITLDKGEFLIKDGKKFTKVAKQEDYERMFHVIKAAPKRIRSSKNMEEEAPKEPKKSDKKEEKE